MQHFLDHKKLTSTKIYVNIKHTLFEAGANDEFTAKIAEEPDKVKALLEIGFKHALQKDNLIFLRKRK
jgi:hypothetical protein